MSINHIGQRVPNCWHASMPAKNPVMPIRSPSAWSAILPCGASLNSDGLGRRINKRRLSPAIRNLPEGNVSHAQRSPAICLKNNLRNSQLSSGTPVFRAIGTQPTTDPSSLCSKARRLREATDNRRKRGESGMLISKSGRHALPSLVALTVATLMAAGCGSSSPPSRTPTRRLSPALPSSSAPMHRWPASFHSMCR